MKILKYLLPVIATAVATGACSTNRKAPAQEEQSRYAMMASETFDSLYAHYSVEGQTLLRENYPFDADFRAGYLAEAAEQTNPYSYLWPFSGTVSAARALYDATGDTAYITLLRERVMPGLNQYLDTLRAPAAYASYVNSAPQSDRFYDDNIWLGIDFTDFYLATSNPDYLDTARMIWKFIESGTDDKLGGGIYWCEQKKGGKNTCSNAPGSVYALKLFKATGDSAYLDAGKALYHWTKTNLQDTTDCLYFDHVLMNGRIGRAKFAYNAGQMMQAAALLYQLTGDEAYLTDAQDIARGAHKHFFSGVATDAAGEFPLLERGNIWFTAVMMRGFYELYLADGNPAYMNDFVRNLDQAWSVMRDASTGLFNEDWSGKEKKDKQWLLTQGAMVEMLATAAAYDKANH